MVLVYKELELTNEQRKQLNEEVLTISHPLGASVYEYTDHRYDPHLYHLLFNWHPEHFHEDEGRRPSIILGRRGAGKSSYLNNLSHKENVIPVIVKSWEAVDLVEKHVRIILQNQNDVDAETVAGLWNLVFLVSASKKLLDFMPNSEKLKKLIMSLPIKDFATKGMAVVTREVLELVRRRYLSEGKSSFSLSLISDSVGLGEGALEHFPTSLNR